MLVVMAAAERKRLETELAKNGTQRLLVRDSEDCDGPMAYLRLLPYRQRLAVASVRFATTSLRVDTERRKKDRLPRELRTCRRCPPRLEMPVEDVAHVFGACSGVPGLVARRGNFKEELASLPD